MAMLEPTAPDLDEVEFYYYGIIQCPRLVARSSPHVWVHRQNPNHTRSCFYPELPYSLYPKTLHAVGRHPLLHRLWNDAGSSLRIQILQAIREIDWTSVDFLRVGHNGEYQITLMVAVRPGTLTWNYGHPVALRCKSVLDEHGIHDVPCEILEAVLHFRAEGEPKNYPTVDSEVETGSGPTTLQLFSGPASTKHEDRSHRIKDLTDRLGTQIATSQLNNVSISSTKGLYLSIRPTCSEDEPQVVALTCRHLMIDSKTEGTQKYQKSRPFRDVIQMDQRTCMSHLWHFEEESESDSKSGHESSEGDQTHAAASPAAFGDNAMVLAHAMRFFIDASSRVFGRLLYSPGFSVAFTMASDFSEFTWLRDWALIELLPNSHRAALGSIQNIVYLGTENSIRDCISRNGEQYQRRLMDLQKSFITNGELKLQRVAVPMEEIFTSPETENVHESGLLVGKYGASGQLSFGLGNTLKSLVRHIVTSEGGRETKIMSEEWAIISTTMNHSRHWAENHRQDAFACVGDFGSCVWDMQGRPAGIITAGSSGSQPAIDGHITYVQPLERLLKDVSLDGFDVELV
ncbi:hypothetical protein CFAM422_003447 [Trichoderma lentiforme]|uniref:Uncharacterized protein n=1 Tax=Trichoderma lentiforme TaxID=1567552 RepID=A0A9P4XIY0_9HYPO|nr:hypothetical protein CFAM422_003447 [Trichoderma lentiforme]